VVVAVVNMVELRMEKQVMVVKVVAEEVVVRKYQIR
jgi:hypothetical protein